MSGIYHKIHSIYKRYTEGENKGKFIFGKYSRPEFEFLKDIEWTWTEKVDGTNIRILWHSDPNISEVVFKGKTDISEMPKHLLARLIELFPEDLMVNVFGIGEEKPDVCLYGEGYGYKIQKGGKYFLHPKTVGFVLFDIKIGNTFLKRKVVEEIAEKLNIDVVPIVGRGTLEQAIDFVKGDPTSTFGEKNFIMEGVITKPSIDLRDRMGNRIITKIKYCDFKEE